LGRALVFDKISKCPITNGIISYFEAVNGERSRGIEHMGGRVAKLLLVVQVPMLDYAELRAGGCCDEEHKF